MFEIPYIFFQLTKSCISKRIFFPPCPPVHLFVCVFVRALLFEMVVRGVCLCVLNQGVHTDTLADVVDWLLIKTVLELPIPFFPAEKFHIQEGKTKGFSMGVPPPPPDASYAWWEKIFVELPDLYSVVSLGD